jgi:hypothetical protein
VFFETMLAVTVVAWLLAWGLKRSHVIVAD